MNGCESDVSGAVAEADTLGIFGRYSVFAATAWPLGDSSPGNDWAVAAFDAYRNYDGKGGTVGDAQASVVADDTTDASFYAFTHQDGSAGMEIVAINKTCHDLAANISLANAAVQTVAGVYQIVDGDTAQIVAVDSVPAFATPWVYTLPPLSVTTIVTSLMPIAVWQVFT